MKLQFSLATLLVCVTVLAVVFAVAIRLGVYESDLSKAVRFSPTVSRYPYLYRPPNATEIAIRLAWSAPLAILLTLGVLWGIRFHPRFSFAALIVLIAALCVWAGFEFYRVQVRKRWLSQIEAGGGRVRFSDTFREKYPKLEWEAPPEVYWLRRLLGDRALYDVFVVVSDPYDRVKRDAELAPIQAVFPEANVDGALVKQGNNRPAGSDGK
jgi:hypothetical protein